VLIASSGWWTFIVDSIPDAARPFIGGSGDNTVTGLLRGYDGLERIFGQGRGASGVSSAASAIERALRGQSNSGFGGGMGFGGTTGLDRMLNSQQAGEIS